MLNKVDIMKELLDRYEQMSKLKELLDRYEQIGPIKDEYIASIFARYMEQYIRKLEIRLAIELVGDESWKQKN